MGLATLDIAKKNQNSHKIVMIRFFNIQIIKINIKKVMTFK